MEFARWYLQTGGLPGGQVLFTSFKKHTTLVNLLKQIGQVFSSEFERKGIDWLSLSDSQRYDETLQILLIIPVVWVWDSVESVAGCPTGVPSDWTRTEQLQLVEFLRKSVKTKAKFLLTSRRDEQNWLDGLPVRITLEAMPMSERAQLAQILAEKRGHHSDSLEYWQPLLRFSGGNPLTLILVLNEVLERGLGTAHEINAFTAQLQAGTVNFWSEENKYNFELLRSSLCFGFERAFSKEDQQKLAYLRFFRTIVRADILSLMGSTDTQFTLPELHGLTEEAWTSLLNRAAEFGLLSGSEFYIIHPALPCIAQELFGRPYRPKPSTVDQTDLRTQCRFAEVMGVVGDNCYERFAQGDRRILWLLAAYEENLLYAYQLALSYGLWEALTKTMQGLRALYDETERLTDWRGLVGQVDPHFAVADTEGPLPGREDNWHLTLAYRIDVARRSGDLPEAERLGRLLVDWTRRRAAPVLEMATGSLDVFGRFFIQSLAAALQYLGEILRMQHKTECLGLFEESLALASQLGYKRGMAIVNFSIAQACYDDQMSEIRDFDKAEYCLKESLKLFDKSLDKVELTGTYWVLGQLCYKRFTEAREHGQSEELLRHELREAINSDKMALTYCPPFKKDFLVDIHRDLARLYSEQGDFNEATRNFWESIRYMKAEEEMASNAKMESSSYDHAKACLAQAINLTQSERSRGVTWETGQLRDARECADTALREFEQLGVCLACNLSY
jgi:tetratricopeptide (TPR) repeat protein